VSVNLFLCSNSRRFEQPLFHDPSAFCRVICAQAGMERDRSGVVENTVPFDIWKFRKVKPEFLVEWNAPIVCEPELENDFCDVGILSQSQFSSEKPRTAARGIHASQEYKVQQQWRIMWMNYLTAARVAARSTRVSLYHALWLANEKTKVVTSQKSFSSTGSQTLFSAEPVTEKIRLRSQATV